MKMSATTSASKGCFVFKGTRPTAPEKSPRKRGKQSNTDSSFSEVFGDCDANSAVQRFEAYKQTWKYMETKIKAIIAKSHSSLLEDTTSFVSQHSPNVQRVQHSSIPTAFVTLGVNIPDHVTFFSLLEAKLRERCTPYIAMVNSKESLTLKALVARVLQRLMHIPQLDLDHEDLEPLEGATQPTRPKVKSLQALVDWYETCDKKPLVVVFQDLEAFGQQQLQDFVLLCREYWTLHKLPLVFIMGVATATVAQQQLHHRTAVSLWAKTFQSQPSVTLLNELFEQLIMATNPNQRALRLSPRLIRLLLDAFLYHDLSVNGFVQRLHIIVLQHFVTLPQAVLCCGAADLKQKVESLSKEQLELHRELPSFMKFVEADKTRSSAVLLIDDKKFCDFLSTSLSDIDVQADTLGSHCRVLHFLSVGLPGTIFGKSLREVYCFVLANDLKTTGEWSQFIQLLKLSSAPELQLRLENSLSALEKLECANETLSATKNRLADIRAKLQGLELKDSRSKSSPTKQKPALNLQGKKLDRFQLQEQLLASAKQGKRSLSSFELIREELVNWITSELADSLRQPSCLPFNEIFYAGSVTQGQWDIVPFMRRQIQPAPRVAIHRALTNPHFYLRCECCKDSSEAGCLRSTMPDISVAYKLHTECGRLINLYDWMTAFCSVTKTEETEDTNGIDPVTQARFVRAVSELQFLGFVQSSKRKTDHVARLTWGV